MTECWHYDRALCEYENPEHCDHRSIFGDRKLITCPRLAEEKEGGSGADGEKIDRLKEEAEDAKLQEGLIIGVAIDTEEKYAALMRRLRGV